MKYRLMIYVSVAVLLLASGCRKNPNAIIELPTGPEFAGEYLETSDVRRIGHALNTAPDRQTVQWENAGTGYQFSMMVFGSDEAAGTISRSFTVLTIATDNTAEVLNLIGRSTEKNVWNIQADGPAVVVGKATRMQLVASPSPQATTSSGSEFNGFIVME